LYDPKQQRINIEGIIITHKQYNPIQQTVDFKGIVITHK